MAEKGCLSARDIPLDKIPISKIQDLYRNTTEKGECLLYNSVHHTGYSYISVSGKSYPVHRFVKALSIGKNYPGLVTDHTCGVKNCIRLSHLEVVTQGVNISRGTAHDLWATRERSKTHCPQGHEYSVANTYRNPTSGHRLCITCQKHKTRRMK